MCKEMPVIPVNKVVDKKRLIEKGDRGRGEGLGVNKQISDPNIFFSNLGLHCAEFRRDGHFGSAIAGQSRHISSQREQSLSFGVTKQIAPLKTIPF
jgi:hypothetical protein